MRESLAGADAVKRRGGLRGDTATGRVAGGGRGPVGTDRLMTTNDQNSATDGSDDGHNPERAHLDGVEDGCGCAEVWEHLSERREAGAD